MKTFRLIGMALMAIMFSFSFASCDDDDDVDNYGNNELLIGEWQQTWSKGYEIFNGEKEEFDEAQTDMFVTFKADGTGFDSETGEKFPFVWKLNGNVLTITYTDEGEEDSNSVIVKQLNETTFQFEDKGEDYYFLETFKKLK